MSSKLRAGFMTAMALILAAGVSAAQGGSGASGAAIRMAPQSRGEMGRFGLSVGAGWDVRLGRNIYLTPNVDALFQWFDSKDDPVLGPIPGNNTILMFTLGLTWH